MNVGRSVDVSIQFSASRPTSWKSGVRLLRLPMVMLRPNRNLRMQPPYPPAPANQRATHWHPSPPPHRFGQKFGTRYAYCVDSIRENLWPCNPRARKGSAAGSVASTPGTPKTAKLVTFLGLADSPTERVPWIENPCVGGSIPPQATRFKAHLLDGFFIDSNAGIAQLVERYLAKV